MTNKLFILYFHKNGARICGNYYGGIMYKDIFINLSLFYPDFYDSYEKLIWKDLYIQVQKLKV